MISSISHMGKLRQREKLSQKRAEGLGDILVFLEFAVDLAFHPDSSGYTQAIYLPQSTTGGPWRGSEGEPFTQVSDSFSLIELSSERAQGGAFLSLPQEAGWTQTLHFFIHPQMLQVTFLWDYIQARVNHSHSCRQSPQRCPGQVRNMRSQD